MEIERLFEIIKARGLKVAIGDDGNLRLKGKKADLTPALVDVIADMKEEIRRRLQLQKEVEPPPQGPLPSGKAPAEKAADDEPCPRCGAKLRDGCCTSEKCWRRVCEDPFEFD